MGVEVEDVTTVFKIGTILLLVSILFQLVGMGSSHWVLTIRDDLGVIEYNGLWDKCSDLAVGTGHFKCSGFVWEDVQVSRMYIIFFLIQAVHLSIKSFTIVPLLSTFFFLKYSKPLL